MCPDFNTFLLLSVSFLCILIFVPSRKQCSVYKWYGAEPAREMDIEYTRSPDLRRRSDTSVEDTRAPAYQHRSTGRNRTGAR